MIKKSLFCRVPALIVIVLLCCNLKPLAQNSYPPEMFTAAKLALDTLLTRDRRDFFIESHYVSPDEKFENVTLGEPYPEYRLERDKILKLQDCDAFKTCLTFISWHIPIYFDDQPRTLMDMWCPSGKWEWGGVGGNPVPFLEARALWPASDGYKISYVVDLGGLDYFMIERGEDIGLYSYREGSDRVLGISKDKSGQYPLLAIPFVVRKLKAERRPHFNPTLE